MSVLTPRPNISSAAPPAGHCKECKNFNSLFNIVSGLSHGAVGRLKQTWEKLPTKYQKIYNDMLVRQNTARGEGRI